MQDQPLEFPQQMGHAPVAVEGGYGSHPPGMQGMTAPQCLVQGMGPQGREMAPPQMVPQGREMAPPHMMPQARGQSPSQIYDPNFPAGGACMISMD